MALSHYCACAFQCYIDLRTFRVPLVYEYHNTTHYDCIMPGIARNLWMREHGYRGRNNTRGNTKQLLKSAVRRRLYIPYSGLQPELTDYTANTNSLRLCCCYYFNLEPYAENRLCVGVTYGSWLRKCVMYSVAPNVPFIRFTSLENWYPIFVSLPSVVLALISFMMSPTCSSKLSMIDG